MSKVSKFNVSLVFVVCLLCLAFCGLASADNTEPANLTETPVYIDGLLSCRGYVIGDTTYIPIKTACDVLGYRCDIQFDTIENTLTVFIEDIELTVGSGDKYLTANGRCLYLPDGYKEIDGSAVFPVDVTAKLFTLDVKYDELSGVYDLGTENAAVLLSGDEFYNDNDLYWMSRIISYEAGNQPFEGQIGVGNVVMNRVHDSNFPNSVKEVIFDEGQFSPVDSGAIYLDPYERCIVTAKIALEDCSVVGNALYFHIGDYGEKATTQNKYFVAKIGDHNFFERIDNLKYL